MMLAANALGVQSLFTTFFFLKSAEIRELLGIPPQIFMECAVFLGYGDEPLGNPKRKPVPDVTHLNSSATATNSARTTGERQHLRLERPQVRPRQRGRHSAHHRVQHERRLVAPSAIMSMHSCGVTMRCMPNARNEQGRRPFRSR